MIPITSCKVSYGVPDIASSVSFGLSIAWSAIVIACKAWAKNGDYWTVYFDLLETVKVKFDEAGIIIPYNQLDVHVKNN